MNMLTALHPPRGCNLPATNTKMFIASTHISACCIYIRLDVQMPSQQGCHALTTPRKGNALPQAERAHPSEPGRPCWQQPSAGRGGGDEVAMLAASVKTRNKQALKKHMATRNVSKEDRVAARVPSARSEGSVVSRLGRCACCSCQHCIVLAPGRMCKLYECNTCLTAGVHWAM